MLCKFLKVVKGLPRRCGGCLPCLIKKRREWTSRIILEQQMHKMSCFLNLTFDDDHLPADGSLDRRIPTLFLKRLRKAYPGLRIAYYMAGEYGGKFQRPHYHMALFGLPGCEYGQTRVFTSACCRTCEKFKQIWGQGGIFLGELNEKTAGYVAGYVTKKMDHPERRCSDKCTHPPLNGRLPEFSRMSRRPSIGKEAMKILAKSLDNRFGRAEIDRVGDVPGYLMLGKKRLMLGRHLVEVLRGLLKLPEEVKQKKIQAWVYQFSWDRREEDSKRIAEGLPPRTLKQFFDDKNRQKILNTEARYKIKAR